MFVNSIFSPLLRRCFCFYPSRERGTERGKTPIVIETNSATPIFLLLTAACLLCRPFFLSGSGSPPSLFCFVLYFSPFDSSRFAKNRRGAYGKAWLLLFFFFLPIPNLRLSTVSNNRTEIEPLSVYFFCVLSYHVSACVQAACFPFLSFVSREKEKKRMTIKKAVFPFSRIDRQRLDCSMLCLLLNSGRSQYSKRGSTGRKRRHKTETGSSGNKIGYLIG